MARENRLPRESDGSSAREPLELVHHHPGRLRLRADALIGNGLGKNVVDRIRSVLDGTPGVRNVRHNTRTGSLLVEYDPGMADANALLTRIANAAGLGEPLSPRDARRSRRSHANRAIDLAREANALTYELTGWRADLRLVAPMALAGAGIYSLVRNQPNSRLPKWDTLLWYSYSVFTALHAREIGDIEEAFKDATNEIDREQDRNPE
ncbi:MAG: HMA2 domain-containing protein [Polyangiaceae bacterium]